MGDASILTGLVVTCIDIGALTEVILLSIFIIMVVLMWRSTINKHSLW